MKTSQSGIRVFWKNGWLWAALLLLIAVYLIVLRIEERAYTNFIDSQWPTAVIKYNEENSPFVGNYVQDLATDEQGRIWIGTNTALNMVTLEGQWRTYLIEDTGQHINSVAFDRLERTWVGTFDALYVLETNEQWTKYDEQSKIVYEHYNSSAMLIDRSGRIWVANDDGLRMFLPDGTKQFFTKENSGLPDNYITGLAEDRQGNIWIGTRTGGVVVFDQNSQWKTYQVNGTENGLAENWVTEILIDDQDRIWIGTMRRGVSMLSPEGNWTTYDVSEWGRESNPEYYDKEINAFALDKQGRIWIGTPDGLFALDTQSRWTAYTKANSGFNPDYVKALTVDGSGRLWIATLEEVIVLDLQNELPETVSAEWLRLRTILLIPVRVVSATGYLIALVFLPVTVPILGIVYIILLISLPLSMVGLSRSDKRNKAAFTVAFVLSSIGVPLLWILSLFLQIALRD